MSGPSSTARRALRAVALAHALTLGLVVGHTVGAHPAGAEEMPAVPRELTLVTLETPGTAGSTASQEELTAEQDAVLTAVTGETPVYRWSTALNGFAVHLTDPEAEALRADDRVALVEPNSVRPLASAPRAAAAAALESRRTKGGAGVVIGMVDSGIWPESPLFADTPGLGRSPDEFAGACAVGLDWDESTCHRKIVGARWFVAGFDPQRLRATESLSPRDAIGHGTQVASVAAGNGGVSVSAGVGASGVFSGTAPQARLAVYKACWSAPDPDDDGCATADVVTAIDRATADRVDVLNLSIAGGQDFDTVSRALLGAAEADVVVTAAAGNDGETEYAGHLAPWVTTVGGLARRARHGRVEVAGGPQLVGASRASRPSTPAPLLLAGRARATGVPLDEARRCLPGSLDAAQVQGAIVVCQRGGIGRIDKSEVVRRADGAGMVLVNPAGSGVFADVHTVPTVHLGARAGAELVRHLRRDPGAKARLVPLERDVVRARTARWSPSGDPEGPVVKPDLVAPATGVLTSVPPVTGRRWSTLTGTSAASAQVAGLAALVRSKHEDWDSDTVRSAITTSTGPVRDGSAPLRQGAGRLREKAALAPGLAFGVAPGDYRAWLSGDLPTLRLNTPSVLVSRGVVTRRVTNVGSRAMYYSSRATGFKHHRVRVEPAAIRLEPGQSTTFRVVVESAGAPVGDHGTVTWLGAQGTTVRVPVVISR